jgi:hypothetical protein
MCLKYALFLLGISLVSAGADAANYQGTVTNVSPFNGKVYVVVSGGAFDGQKSACPNNTSSMLYSIDPSTPYGRALLATVLSAKLSGRLVYAVGDGTCSTGSMFPGGSAEGLIGVDLKG